MDTSPRGPEIRDPHAEPEPAPVRVPQRAAPRPRTDESQGGGAGRFLAMIGFVVLLNVLSQVFDWGFVFW